MKHKTFRRILSAALTLCMVLTLLPTGAFAATTVTASPGGASLNVKYFTSTLYNWDEVAANAVTLVADTTSGATTGWADTDNDAERVYYSTNGYSTYENSKYYIRAGAAFAKVTSITCTAVAAGETDDGVENTQTYTVYHWTIGYSYTNSDGDTVTGTLKTTDGDIDNWDNITLYYSSDSVTYEGKGFYFTSAGSLWGTSSGYSGESDYSIELTRLSAEVPAYSTWINTVDSNGIYKQNYYIYSGLAASKLSESSNAPFSDDVNAAALFATDGSNEDYAEVYTNVSVPFVYDSSTGYYTLDSDANAVYFADGEAASNATMAIADKPAAYYSESSNGYVTGFAPFDDLTETTTDSAIVSGSTADTTTAYVIEDEDAEEGEETPTYGFGMVTTVDFTMTEDGKDSSTSDPITFQFSGDDDVWVYIDNVLVLDIGGTHEAVDGAIDFSTGDVTLTSAYGSVGDLATDPTMSSASKSLSQTNVYAALDTDLSSFSSAGTHTLTIYYMDRGQNRTNSMITFNLPLAIDAEDDAIVLDYGLPVQVDVLANDTVTSNGAAVSGSDVTLTINNGDDLTYGTAKVDTDDNDNQIIVYTPTEQLNGIETIEYTVAADGRSDTATLTVIPATLMYYEENFGEMVSYSNAAVTWTATGMSNVTYQETGFVGDEDDSTYGTDTAYLSNLGDSGGTSKYAAVTDYAAYFEYDFTGTGTAILARTSTDSAYIRVQIWHEDADGNDVYDEWQYIDTRVVGNVANETELYNIPVYNNEDLEFGTYHVKVFIYKKDTPVNGYYDDDGDLVEGSDKSGGTFYLDGIRVYNPMGTCAEDGVAGYTTAEAAYVADGEDLMSTVNIHAKVVDDDTEGWLEGLTTLTDNYTDISDDIDTYSVDGANEEFYLNGSGYGVICYLDNWDVDNKDFKLYLGIKSPGSTAGSVTIGDEDEGNVITLTISNGTVCYYDVTDYLNYDTWDSDGDGDDDTDYCYLNIAGDSGLVALTNLKLTDVKFSFVNGTNYSVINGGGDDDEDTYTLLTRSSGLYALAYAVAEEEEEATVFVPESITVNCSWASKTKKATVSALTSDDVVRVTINGVDVSSAQLTYSLKWSQSYTKVTSGTTYEVIAYDADGNASETYTVTAQ